MGNKVSAVRDVRSHDFFKPGNAINQIWVGNFELISRLPFGDSDMAQAGWPKGDWPKIPWHQFIIPLKRRSVSLEAGAGAGAGGAGNLTIPPTASTMPATTDTARHDFFPQNTAYRIQLLLTQILGNGINTLNNPLKGLSNWPCFVAAYCLMPIILSAYALPVMLAYDPPSSCGILRALFLRPKKPKPVPEQQQQQHQPPSPQITRPKEWYRFRLYAASGALAVGFTCSLALYVLMMFVSIDQEVSEPGLEPFLNLLVFITVVVITWRTHCSARAVSYIWEDWKKARSGPQVEDCGGGDFKGVIFSAEA